MEFQGNEKVKPSCFLKKVGKSEFVSIVNFLKNNADKWNKTGCSAKTKIKNYNQNEVPVHLFEISTIYRPIA